MIMNLDYFVHQVQYMANCIKKKKNHLTLKNMKVSLLLYYYILTDQPVQVQTNNKVLS